MSCYNYQGGNQYFELNRVGQSIRFWHLYCVFLYLCFILSITSIIDIQENYCSRKVPLLKRFLFYHLIRQSTHFLKKKKKKKKEGTCLKLLTANIKLVFRLFKKLHPFYKAFSNDSAITP